MKPEDFDWVSAYRESHDLDEFIKIVVMAGFSEEDAVDMYYELTAKFEGKL